MTLFSSGLCVIVVNVLDRFSRQLRCLLADGVRVFFVFIVGLLDVVVLVVLHVGRWTALILRTLVLLGFGRRIVRSQQSHLPQRSHGRIQHLGLRTVRIMEENYHLEGPVVFLEWAQFLAPQSKGCMTLFLGFVLSYLLIDCPYCPDLFDYLRGPWRLPVLEDGIPVCSVGTYLFGPGGVKSAALERRSLLTVSQGLLLVFQAVNRIVQDLRMSLEQFPPDIYPLKGRRLI